MSRTVLSVLGAVLLLLLAWTTVRRRKPHDLNSGIEDRPDLAYTSVDVDAYYADAERLAAKAAAGGPVDPVMAAHQAALAYGSCADGANPSLATASGGLRTAEQGAATPDSSVSLSPPVDGDTAGFVRRPSETTRLLG